MIKFKKVDRRHYTELTRAPQADSYSHVVAAERQRQLKVMKEKMQEKRERKLKNLDLKHEVCPAVPNLVYYIIIVRA